MFNLTEVQTQTLLTGGVLNPGDASNKTEKKKGKVNGRSQDSEPGDDDDNDDDDELEGSEENGPTATGPSMYTRAFSLTDLLIRFTGKRQYSKDKVRTSQSDRTLDSMFPVVNSASQRQVIDVDKGDEQPSYKYRSGFRDSEGENATTQETPVLDIKESDCYLSSVNSMREEVQKMSHSCKNIDLSNYLAVQKS